MINPTPSLDHPTSKSKKSKRQRKHKERDQNNNSCKKPSDNKNDDYENALQLFQRDQKKGIQKILEHLKNVEELRKAQQESEQKPSKVFLRTNAEPPFRSQTIVHNAADAYGWEANRLVQVVVDTYTFFLSIVSVEPTEDYLSVNFICPKKYLVEFCGVLQKKGFGFAAILTVILVENSITPSTDFDNGSHPILTQMYTRNLSKIAKMNLRNPMLKPNIETDVRYGKNVLTLTSDQAEAVKIGVSTKNCSVIQSTFGTGKTLVAAFIAANFSKYSEKPILLISITNAAVAQLAKAIHSLNDFAHLNPIRIKSNSLNFFHHFLAHQNIETSVDLKELIKTMDESLITEREKIILTDYSIVLAKIEQCVKKSMAEQKAKFSDFHQIFPKTKSLERLIEQAYLLEEDITEILLKHRKPRVLCLTVDLLFAKILGEKRAVVDFLKDPGMIIIDETSQLPELTFLQLVSNFPNAKFCLIGDVRQLPPYCPTLKQKGDVPLNTKHSILSILYEQSLSGYCLHAKLLTTFRCHPSMMALPSELFYENSLIPGATAKSKSSILNLLNFPNPSNPVAFIDIKSTHYRNPATRSLGNMKECEKCLELVKILIKKNVCAQNISIVVFYKEQSYSMLKTLKADELTENVSVHTVDSIQGSEFDVVIVLTTKTEVSTTEVFLSDPNRVNVAITRAKLASFIFGKKLSLSTLPTWNNLIEWCERESLIITANKISNLAKLRVI